ncbi:maternal effect embryo arrest 66 [Hibiscus trionum]|uniref:Maternal effect embryo arrest 66 n=1 Tax=Hibiscus trionum TaxID=183268 RepID=A0A9W7MCZ3_HIBTR|nr:maternal effect embryo arrest 66 [Hibiscus trionum]
MDFTMMLPKECQSLIVSFTSPADACRSAMVCRALKSAVDLDAVWEKFLPSDFKSIILGSSSPSSLLSLGKKELYLQLCFHPILLQNGTMSFRLEKGSGKKCYMLGARALYIWGETPAYWNWIYQPDSRFALF